MASTGHEALFAIAGQSSPEISLNGDSLHSERRINSMDVLEKLFDSKLIGNALDLPRQPT
jgi:hypothetical protein